MDIPLLRRGWKFPHTDWFVQAHSSPSRVGLEESDSLTLTAQSYVEKMVIHVREYLV